MRAASLGAERRSVVAAEAELVLDVSGRRVEVSCADADRLKEAASREAGRSSVARDLSLLLNRALAGGGTLALRHGEVRTLTRMAESLGMSDLAARLSAAA
ncbi:MAG TPA: hypothetical protein VII54_11695 [Gaiellaceae bacterium]|jgi:hypothetical protein